MTQNEFNPYVGPRPFERKREDSARFFGRSQETEEIVSLIFGHPVILVYAQSGAGKTSLFNASVALKLEESGFDVLPLTRVGGVVPKGIALPEIKNLYVFNALLKIDSGTGPRSLLSTSLGTFLGTHVRTVNDEGQPLPRVIIFDQFEELFTYTPEHWREQREGFFLQVIEALNADPLLRVVFVIREDFLAELDPYSRNLPERLRTRYRLERLGENAALRAVKDPLVNTARKFAEGVAEGLVKELLAMKTVDATGKTTEIEGQYVEPVQLQVVCVTLWSSLEADCTEIEKTHLKNFNVNDALSNFYKSTLESATKETGVVETNLRNWFGKILITPMGTRSTVFRGEESTGVIENNAVDFLESRHIIRAEFRAGARWYELTHDRLVEPILASNRKWIETLSPLQQQAALWRDQSRGETWLLRDQALVEVEAWAGTHKDELTEVERDFLEACLAKQTEQKAKQESEAQRRELESTKKLADAQMRSAQRAWRISLIALSFLALAIIAAIFAYNSQKQLTVVSRAHELTAKAVFLRDRNFPVSLLLGIEAFKSLDDAQTRGVLLDNMQTEPLLHQILFGHIDSVNSVAFSPDGKLLASSSDDKSVILWDTSTGKSIGQLKGYTGPVYGVAFSPDGQILASGNSDRTITLWDVKTQKPIGEPLVGHKNIVYSVAFSPDGKTLASASWDHTVILWDVATLKPISQLGDIHNDNVVSLAFSPDGKILASGSYDDTIVLWDVTTNQPIDPPLKSNHGNVESVAFSPDGKIIAVASFDNIITFWDGVTHQQIDALKGHSNWVSSVSFSPDGKTLASGSADGTIILWDVATRQPMKKSLSGHSGTVISVAFSPDGKTIASGSLDKVVILWDVTTYSPIAQSLMENNIKISSVSISQDGRTLASGSDDPSFALWNLTERKLISLNPQDPFKFVRAVSFSPDGKTLAIGGDNLGVIFWDVTKEMQFPTKFILNDKTYDYIYSLAFSPDGKTLASGNWENTIILWDLATSKRIGELKGHKQPVDGSRLAVTSVAFSPDGKLLASGSQDNSIILWDIFTQKQFGKQLLGHTNQVYSVAFSPDGKILASASFDRTVMLWDVKTQTPIQQLAGHLSSVQSVAFSPDGKILASGSTDRTIVLWDIKSGQAIGQPLLGPNSSVNSLVFSPDGKTLISGSAGIILWDLAPQSWIEKTCQRVGRNFTRGEWLQYFHNVKYHATCPQWPLEPEVAATPTP